MSVIVTNDVTSTSLARWGVSGAEYTVTGAGYLAAGQTIDFQDLMVVITARRAAVVEDEVKPMQTRMTERNKRLESLGNALSDLSDVEACFSSDDSGSKWSSSLDPKRYLKPETCTLLDSIEKNLYASGDKAIQKSTCEKAIQLVKTQIDRLNNEASSDMTRLQSLVDRRDESYSTATSLMQAIGDTRSSLVKNM